MNIIHLYIVETAGSILSYLMVHNKLAMRFFYSMILNIIIICYIIILFIVIFIRFINISKVCYLLDDYYSKNSANTEEYANIQILIDCSFQKFIYLMWIITDLAIVFVKVFATLLSLRAHRIIKEQIKMMLKAKKAKMA